MELALKEESFRPFLCVRKELEKLLSKCMRVEKIGKPEPYYRGDTSLMTLHYISDRWTCVGRIHWLLDVSQKEQTND